MQLRAASIGSAVPQDQFDATIHSVFDLAVNLRLDHEDRLITILVSDHYDLPQGIRLDVNLPRQFLDVGLRAAARGGILRFDSSPLAIDLRSASIWEGRLPTLIGNIEPAWSIAWSALNARQKLKDSEIIIENLFQDNGGSSLTHKIRQPVLQLLSAAKKITPDDAACAAQKIIGLGVGLTPSGDDLLLGFMAGLHATGNDRQDRLAFIKIFGDEILALSNRTNEISHTYLYHAVRGEFSSSIVAVVESIRDGEEEKFLTRLDNAMQVGHSSGMDAVTGLLIGLAAWGAGSMYSNYEEMNL